MIDTLKLHLKDYSITSDNNLTIQPSPVNSGTGEVLSEFPLFRNQEGREFRGSRAYLNTSKFNLSFRPYSKGEVVTTPCFLQFSIPKVYYGENYYSVGEQGSEAVIKQVEKELWKNGVHTSLKEADISRIDTFKNVETEEPFSSYYTLFSMLKARRAIRRGYGTTWLVHNTQQEFCIYDKLEEMQHRDKDINLSQYPENTMRFEHRLLNKKKVNTVYGFSSCSALFSGGYEQIREKEREVWDKALFSHSVEEVVYLGSQAIAEELKHYKENHRYYFRKFLEAYGAYHLAEYAGVEVIRTALQELGVDKMTIWRAEKKLQEAKRELDFLKQVEGAQDKTMATLYRELQDKVILN